MELRWIVEPTASGFQRELRVRRQGEAEWTTSETIEYTPLEPVSLPTHLPSLQPGPFHDPDACATERFREMDYSLGHWFNEEWIYKDEAWAPGTVSEVSVRSIVGGCALIEKHPIYDGGEPTTRLLLVRAFDVPADRWRQFVFDVQGGVWEWDIERADPGWRLTPSRGEMVGRLRILERPTSSGFAKSIEILGEDGEWRDSRLIRYVPW